MDDAPVKALLLVLGGFLLVVAVAVGGLAAFVRSGDGGSEAHLSRQLGAFVTRAEFSFDNRGTTSRGFDVELRYELDGQEYVATAWVPEGIPDVAPTVVKVCVDPADPEAHAVPTRPGADCGDSNLGRNGEQRAEPATAP